MKGIIIIGKNDGRSWIYVPDAHIQFQTATTGDGFIIVCAFRTDGYHRTDDGFIPTVDWLRATHHFTTELEVPEHIVVFAVESERQRQDEVSGIAAIFERAIETGTLAGAGETLEELPAGGSGDEEQEHQIGLAIQKLMADAGGQP